MLLVVLSELVRPGIVNPGWARRILRSAMPLAILAGCQTLTMLTGGIDLSVGAVASMTGFVVATLVGGQGLPSPSIVALVIAALAGLLTGIGVGVFRVHPLIMTLGMGLVVLGLANVWQIVMVQTGAGVPADPAHARVGHVPRRPAQQPGRLRAAGRLSSSLGLRRTGYGRLLYAVGDNPIAARLSGARSWQVLVVLYMISALIAAIAGFLYHGPQQRRQRDARGQRTCCRPWPRRSSAGRRSWVAVAATAGRWSGALILTVLTSLLTSLGLPEAVRQVLFGSIIVVVAAAYTRVTAES